MTILVNSFSVQITPIKDALGNNKIIESSSISYKNGIFDRIIRYK